jgi:hypothetical protein
MSRRAFRPLLTVALVLTIALAFSPVGRWEGVISGPANLTVNYTFSVDGEQLNGSINLLDHGAEFPLENGTVYGDSLRFTVDFAGMAVLHQRGRVSGDSLILWTHFGDDNEFLDVFSRMP